MFSRYADEDRDAELLKQKRRQSRKCTEGKKDFKALLSSATGLTKGKGSLKGLWNAVKQDQESFYLEIKQALKDDKADAIQLFLDRHNMTPKSLINGIVEVLKGSDVDDVWEDNIKNKVINGMKKKVLQRERKELTEIIPKSFLTYLPKSLVVNVGENGKIKEMKTVYAEQINDMKAKMDRQKKLLNCIDDLKKQLTKDLKSKDEDKKLCAVIISLMLETGIRPGNLESKDLEETYGASTLEEGHIKFLSRNRVELKFRGKKFLFELNTLALMFVPIAVQIPRYLIIARSGLIDSYAAHILPVIVMPVAMFLIKQFIDQTPNELIESAKIDGASEMQIFLKIIMPIIAPAIATVGILAFQAIWNDTTTSVLYINDESKRTLAFYMMSLTSMQGNTVAGQGMAAAASLLMFIPNLLLFIILQGKVMNTMAHSGIK